MGLFCSFAIHEGVSRPKIIVRAVTAIGHALIVIKEGAMTYNSIAIAFSNLAIFILIE
jgi:hypothetical protein